MYLCKANNAAILPHKQNQTRKHMKNFETFTKEPVHIPMYQRGASNGYVVIPQNSPLFGMSYDDIMTWAELHEIELDVELTLAEFANKLGWSEIKDKSTYIVGFDTCHYGMTPTNWPMAKVLAETEKLASALKELSNRLRYN